MRCACSTRRCSRRAQRLGAGKIVVPTPAQSQASSVAVRKEADKSCVDWVDKEIGKFYANGQTQKWYEEFLVGFGLDPKALAAGDEGNARQVVAGRTLGLAMHVWNFAPVWANADLLALGLLNTLKVTGAALALRRAARPRAGADAALAASPAAWPAGAVIEVFRTTPPLVQLFWFFFALPILIVRVEMTPFVAAVLHLLDPVGRLLRRGVPRRHRLGRARPVGGGARARHDAAPGDAPRSMLPQAVKRMIPGLPGARDRG